MNIRWLVAAVHLLGMAMALGAVTSRARAFEGPLDTAGVQRVLRAEASMYRSKLRRATCS
jgi:hypothetical protein